MKKYDKKFAAIRHHEGSARLSPSEKVRLKLRSKVMELEGKVELSFTVEELLRLRKRDLRLHRFAPKNKIKPKD